MGGLFGGGSKTVGKEIRESDITEFYYTLSGPTNPPHYQRYHFYTVGGRVWFYHEKREGRRWPLQEEDVTRSGKKELDEKQKGTLFACLKGGSVKARSEDLTSGGDGPWLYLYWKGDRGDVQAFSFASYEQRLAFEKFCGSLLSSTAYKESLPVPVYYVQSQQDSTVLVGVHVRILHSADGTALVTWWDPSHERRMTAQEIRKAGDSFSFTRIAKEGGQIYRFVPMTLELYRRNVKDHLIGKRDFDDEQSMIDAFLSEGE